MRFCAVESDPHMMADFHITSNRTDHGMLAPTMVAPSETMPEEIVKKIARELEKTGGEKLNANIRENV